MSNILYFSTNTSTNKVLEIKLNNKGLVYFFDQSNFVGCLLKGNFKVSMEMEDKHKVWKNGDEMYYPKGIMDEDFCVLIFNIQSARIYRNFKSIELCR